MVTTKLSKLLLINGLFTFIGGVILIIIPNTIFGWVGIQLSGNIYVISYLLGVTSISFSVLSLYATLLKDRDSLKAISLTFLIFHLASAIVGINGLLHGLHAVIWINIVIHLTFSLLFLYLGFVQLAKNEGVENSI
jgi:hypothetical protein